jgi:hypothetical protein
MYKRKKKAAKKTAKKTTKKYDNKKAHPGWGGRRVKGIKGPKWVNKAQKKKIDEIVEEFMEGKEPKSTIKLFTKEKNIPIPPGRTYVEVEDVRKKIETLSKYMRPQESFVIPSMRIALAKTHLHKIHPNKLWRVRKIEDNPEYARVWLIR